MCASGIVSVWDGGWKWVCGGSMWGRVGMGTVGGCEDVCMERCKYVCGGGGRRGARMPLCLCVYKRGVGGVYVQVCVCAEG